MDFIDFQKKYQCYRQSEDIFMFMKPKSYTINQENPYFVSEKKIFKNQVPHRLSDLKILFRKDEQFKIIIASQNSRLHKLLLKACLRITVKF